MCRGVQKGQKRRLGVQSGVQRGVQSLVLSEAVFMVADFSCVVVLHTDIDKVMCGFWVKSAFLF